MRLTTNTDFIPKLPYFYPPDGGILMEVGLDEPVYAFQEAYALTRDYTEEHRWQCLLIPRGNRLAAFWWDLGPADGFKMMVDDASYRAPAYNQLVVFEHSVAECRYMADNNRMDDFAVQLLHNQVGESTLFEDYARMIEQNINLVKNRSSFGTYAVVQRDGYSGTGAREQQEKLKESGKLYG